MIGIAFLRFLVIASVVVLPNFAQAHFPPGSCVERLKRVRSSVNPGETKAWVQTNHFVTWRDLYDYETKLTAFTPLIERLMASGGVYLDSGAGFARVQVELIGRMRRKYHTGKLPLRFIANSLKYPQPIEEMFRMGFSQDDYARHQINLERAKELGDLIYDEGDVIHLAERQNLAGQVDLITDFYGPATYSNFALVLTSYLQMLKPGGRAILFIPPLKIEQPGVKDTSVDFAETRDRYFAEASGFKVSVNRTANLLLVTRTEDPINVPMILHVKTELDLGKEELKYEWVKTRDDWNQSRFNPSSVFYKGKAAPREFVPPSKANSASPASP